MSGVSISLLDFDTHDQLVNCANGTLNLETGKLQPHNPRDLQTKMTPIPFVPGATAPTWEKFIQKVTRNDQDLLRFLQQITGEGLAGRQQDDILPICYGPGSNGKTVFSEMIKRVLGNYASMANSDLFLAKQTEGISNDRAALVGVRFLTASETDEGRKLNEALVKGMTGGDTQRVRFLHKEFFEYTPQFTPMLFTNHKPLINGTDNGIWRRVKLIPWLHNFEQDPEREDKAVVMAKMQQEASGILNWIYAGYKDRQAHGKLFVPNRVQQETNSYRSQSDTMGEFLEDYCVVTEEGAQVTKKELYEKYKEFAVNAGQSNTATEKGFGMRLRERSDIPYLGETRIHGGVRCWVGIRLRTENDPNPTPEPKAQPKQENEPMDNDTLITEMDAALKPLIESPVTVLTIIDTHNNHVTWTARQTMVNMREYLANENTREWAMVTIIEALPEWAKLTISQKCLI